MDQPRPTKYVSFPVPGSGERWSENFGRMIPCFDMFTMLRSDHERLMAYGGEEAVRNWIAATRGTAVN